MTRLTIPSRTARQRSGRRGRLRALFGLVALGVCFAGCSGLFGIDVPPVRTNASRSGEGGAGDSSAAGSNEGGAANVNPEGDAGVTDGGDAGSSEGGQGNAGLRGSGSGGRGGNPARAGRSAGGAGGGGNGSAGTAGRAEFPTLDSACSREGELACVERASHGTLICEGGVWTENRPCSQGTLCDRRTGACGAPYLKMVGNTGTVDLTCDGAQPGDKSCSYDRHTLMTCGPDLVTATFETCMFNCDSSKGVCIAPSNDELILEQPPSVDAAGNFWPGPSVPVCFTQPTVAQKWKDAVRDEVERTWGRYAGVHFDGWGDCTEDVAGVKFSFRPESVKCEAELGAIDHVGYPGAGGSVTIELCLGYLDAGGIQRDMDEPLLRLVARHEFAHALGFDDAAPYAVLNEFMSRGIYASDLSVYTFEYRHIWPLQRAYGFKPSGSIVDSNGRCLTPSDGVPTFTVCDGSAEQAFHFMNDQLWDEGNSTCLRAGPSDGTLSFAACAPSGSTADPEQIWQPDHVLMHPYGHLCVYDNGFVATDECDSAYTNPVWDMQLIDGGRRFRFREDAQDECIAVTSDAIDTDSHQLELIPCDTCATTAPGCDFEFTDAEQIANDDVCIGVAGDWSVDSPFAPPTTYAAVYHGPCSLQQRMAWSLELRFVGGTNQLLAERADSPVLVAVPVDPSAPRPAILTDSFDYYPRAAR